MNGIIGRYLSSNIHFYRSHLRAGRLCASNSKFLRFPGGPEILMVVPGQAPSGGLKLGPGPAEPFSDVTDIFFLPREVEEVEEEGSFKGLGMVTITSDIENHPKCKLGWGTSQLSLRSCRKLDRGVREAGYFTVTEFTFR